MQSQNRFGFTLVEIMIVVAIIALLAAIAIPNLLRARANANESAAASTMKTLASVAISYRSVNPTYPALLASLASPNATPPYIDSVLASGAKQGYNFTLAGSTNTFTVTSAPLSPGTTGTRRFFVDESGVVRASATGVASVTSDVLD